MATHGFCMVCVLFLISIIPRIECFTPGYSYAKFMGPVSGAEQKVVYDDGHYHKDYDYVAKPDYHFEYGVQDPKSMVHQSRQETRNGDTVHGEYSVLDPDGKFRTVRYTADKHTGFHADIITDGHSVHHPQDPVKPIHQDPVHPYVPYVPPEHDGNDDGGTTDGGGGEEDEYGEGDEEEEGGEEEGEEEGGDGDEEYTDSGGDEEEEEYY